LLEYNKNFDKLKLFEIISTCDVMSQCEPESCNKASVHVAGTSTDPGHAEEFKSASPSNEQEVSLRKCVQPIPPEPENVADINTTAPTGDGLRTETTSLSNNISRRRQVQPNVIT
jgi:hypothetical protein